MEKKKNILQETIDLVCSQKGELEEEFCNFNDGSADLSLIEQFFPGDSIEYEKIKSLSEDELSSIIKKVYAEDRNNNLLEASCFLLKNDIPLVAIQKQCLSEFVGDIQTLKKKLSSNQKEYHILDDTIKNLERLEKELNIALKDGFIKNDLVDMLAVVLDFDDKVKYEYMIEVLKYNQESYENLLSKNSLIVEEEMTSIDMLSEVFSKYGYNISSLDSKYIKKLEEYGDLDKIEGVFRAITSNRMKFLKEKRKSKLLVQFLLYSDEEIINDVCRIFKDNHVEMSRLSSYLLAFFPDDDKKDINVITKNGKRNKQDDDSTKEDTNDISVKGIYKDFLNNFNFIISHFDVDKNKLLERGIRVLTLPHNSLLKHIDELELYGYDIYGENFPLSALCASKIMDSTDRFIEIGEEAYIKRFASRLLYTCEDIVNRIYAYKDQGLDYHSAGREGMIKTNVVTLCLECDLPSGTIEKIVPKDVDLLLKSSKYNKYKELLDNNSPAVISASTLSDPIVVQLEEKFKINDSIYLFDDVVISRRKLLRNYDYLKNTTSLSDSEKDIHDMLFVSTINNSLLTIDKFEKIDSELRGVLANVGGKHAVSKK